MMRSLFSGVSGLNNHQTRMDTIGHNVSNVNTHGYKKNRVTFQDLLSQTLGDASRPNQERGGINPRQVGLGVQIAATDTIHTQGSLQTTGVNTDLAITGSGFFVQREGEETIYSRAGSFSLDSEGTLVNPANGFRVQGYQAVTAADGSSFINTSGSIEDIRVEIGKKEEAQATTLVRFRSNLNLLTPTVPNDNPTGREIADGTWISTIKVVDSRGEDQELRLAFTKRLDGTGNEIPNEWVVNTTIFDKDGNEIEGLEAGVNEADTSSDFIIRFNEAGAILSVSDPADPDTPIGANGDNLNVQLRYQPLGSEPANVTLELGTAGLYDGITQFASPSSTKAYFQDGTKLGYLESFTINDSGIIVGSYTNGVKRELAQVAIATFTNPQGLEKIGETYFDETINSGLANISAAGSEAAGKIRSGMLEMSNVDLATEFTDMIVTQRGFQANSRSITTSDTMLGEVLRLKQ